MSQVLVPVKNSSGVEGLTPVIITAPFISRSVTLSEEYRIIRKLFVSKTEWVVGGRPIYRRLPAVGEAYQVDFFADGGIGYTYIPLGNDQFGAGSMYVAVSEDLRSLLIYDGVIVWEEGTTFVLKAVINFEEIGLQSGRFLVAYQQIYNADPEPLPFEVTDFSLAGLDFDVNDSASAVFLSTEKPNPNAWPYPGEYAFLPEGAGLSWKNFLSPVNETPQSTAGVRPGLPETYNPILAYLTWSSPLPWKLDTIVLRTPLKFNLPNASLYFKQNGEWTLIQTASVSSDATGFYWVFSTNDIPQNEWKVEWPEYTKIKIESITVSGILYINTKPTTERTRAQLAIYPTNLIPEDVYLCRLAIINVNDFEIQKNDRGELLVEDIRNISNRDYEPVANWLTEFFDENLTNLQQEVKYYAPGYMAPPTLLIDAYLGLEKYDIKVSNETPLFPPSPPEPTATLLLGASVSFLPILP